MLPPNLLSPLAFRPTILDLNLDRLARNCVAIKQRVVPAKVLAVVKANAYGHGLGMSSRVLQEHGVDAFGVALVEEGIALRNAGITVPILVFGGIFGGQIELYLDYDLDLTASSIAKLDAIDKVARARGVEARVHLKIDTGMGRIGVRPESAAELLARADKLRGVRCVGVFSHLACADEAGTDFTNQQIAEFIKVTELLGIRDPAPLRHLANSAAILDYPAAYFDMVRAGVLLYGVPPSETMSHNVDVQPVMQVSSRVVYFKVVPAGGTVGYGATWRAKKATRVVTVPIGYGDGYSRALSNRAEVLIRGKRCPIVGNVCMDQIMVSIGDGEAFNGDEVVLLGRQGNEEITVAELARHAHTVPHEILTNMNLRIPRRYTYRGRTWIE